MNAEVKTSIDSGEIQNNKLALLNVESLFVDISDEYREKLLGIIASSLNIKGIDTNTEDLTQEDVRLILDYGLKSSELSSLVRSKEFRTVVVSGLGIKEILKGKDHTKEDDLNEINSKISEFGDAWFDILNRVIAKEGSDFRKYFDYIKLSKEEKEKTVRPESPVLTNSRDINTLTHALKAKKSEVSLLSKKGEDLKSLLSKPSYDPFNPSTLEQFISKYPSSKEIEAQKASVEAVANLDKGDDLTSSDLSYTEFNTFNQNSDQEKSNGGFLRSTWGKITATVGAVSIAAAASSFALGVDKIKSYIGLSDKTQVVAESVYSDPFDVDSQTSDASQDPRVDIDEPSNNVLKATPSQAQQLDSERGVGKLEVEKPKERLLTFDEKGFPVNYFGFMYPTKEELQELGLENDDYFLRTSLYNLEQISPVLDTIAKMSDAELQKGFKDLQEAWSKNRDAILNARRRYVESVIAKLGPITEKSSVLMSSTARRLGDDLEKLENSANRIDVFMDAASRDLTRESFAGAYNKYMNLVMVTRVMPEQADDWLLKGDLNPFDAKEFKLLYGENASYGDYLFSSLAENKGGNNSLTIPGSVLKQINQSVGVVSEDMLLRHVDIKTPGTYKDSSHNDMYTPYSRPYGFLLGDYEQFKYAGIDLTLKKSFSGDYNSAMTDLTTFLLERAIPEGCNSLQDCLKGIGDLNAQSAYLDGGRDTNNIPETGLNAVTKEKVEELRGEFASKASEIELFPEYNKSQALKYAKVYFANDKFVKAVAKVYPTVEVFAEDIFAYMSGKPHKGVIPKIKKLQEKIESKSVELEAVFIRLSGRELKSLIPEILDRKTYTELQEMVLASGKVDREEILRVLSGKILPSLEKTKSADQIIANVYGVYESMLKELEEKGRVNQFNEEYSYGKSPESYAKIAMASMNLVGLSASQIIQLNEDLHTYAEYRFGLRKKLPLEVHERIILQGLDGDISTSFEKLVSRVNNIEFKAGETTELEIVAEAQYGEIADSRALNITSRFMDDQFAWAAESAGKLPYITDPYVIGNNNLEVQPTFQQSFDGKGLMKIKLSQGHQGAKSLLVSSATLHKNNGSLLLHSNGGYTGTSIARVNIPSGYTTLDGERVEESVDKIYSFGENSDLGFGPSEMVSDFVEKLGRAAGIEEGNVILVSLREEMNRKFVNNTNPAPQNLVAIGQFIKAFTDLKGHIDFDMAFDRMKGLYGDKFNVFMDMGLSKGEAIVHTITSDLFDDLSVVVEDYAEAYTLSQGKYITTGNSYVDANLFDVAVKGTAMARANLAMNYISDIPNIENMYGLTFINYDNLGEIRNRSTVSTSSGFLLSSIGSDYFKRNGNVDKYSFSEYNSFNLREMFMLHAFESSELMVGRFIGFQTFTELSLKPDLIQLMHLVEADNEAFTEIPKRAKREMNKDSNG